MDDDEDKLELDDEKLNFAPFKDLCKRRFLWYYESYVNAIANVENGEKEQKVKDGQKFERMPFEGTGNTMDGVFHYPELKRRLALIKDTINQ
jgi:ubiquitin-conjugating enzyme E2 Z